MSVYHAINQHNFSETNLVLNFNQSEIILVSAHYYLISACNAFCLVNGHHTMVSDADINVIFTVPGFFNETFESMESSFFAKVSFV